MSSSKNRILKFIEEKQGKEFCINEIKNTLKISEEEIKIILERLELDGFIYKNSKDKYISMPENYFIGVLESTKKGNQYIELNDSSRIYVDIDNLNAALNFDTVIVECIDKNNNINKGKIKKILKRKNCNIVCEVINTSTIKNLVVFNTNFNDKLTLCKEAIKKLVVGDRIIVNLEINSQPKFIKKIGHKDDPDNDIKAIAASRDIEIEFSEEAIKEAENLPIKISEDEIKNRLDLRDKNIFTIDCYHTKDMDDAVSIELLPNGNYKLGVHIANVSHYIKRGMQLYKEAESRGNSVYLLDYVIPMLPHIISNGICSLNPNVDRLTKSAIMEIDKKGNVVDYKIVDSIINSKKKMTYEDVNKILEENIVPEGYEPFVNDIKLLNNLSKILSRQRQVAGKLEFVSDETIAIINDEGKATQFNLEKEGASEKIIENSMVIANETVANHVLWLTLPFVYRIHECPDERTIKEVIKLIKDIGFKVKTNGDLNNPKVIQNILKQLSQEEEYPILSNMILQGMKRAKYDTQNLGHFGLASEAYTHFTSPIRRFSDLLVHMLLDDYENFNSIDNVNKYLKDLEKYLKKCCEHISYKERQADLAEEDANKFKMLEYMEEYIGEIFEATIYMIDSKGISIKTDTNITGRIKFDDITDDNYCFDNNRKRAIGRSSKNEYRIGNKILVETKEVSKIDKEIYFTLDKNLIRENKKVKVLTKN